MSLRGVALRLEGPMQAWGGPTAGEVRPTQLAPTKSGILGLVACALGIDRTETDLLVHLHKQFALVVRIDREGHLGVDFHTVLELPDSEGKIKKNAVLTKRRYLYDASFSAVLIEVNSSVSQWTSEDVAQALLYPARTLYLGRRACLPSAPIAISRCVLHGKTWQSLLSQVPLASMGDHRRTNPGRVLVESCLERQPQNSRRERWRDSLDGVERRMFYERDVFWIAFDPQLHAPHSDLPAQNTTDSWMPS